jgi:DNA-binding transcriptional regulator LsrR (DeoR family)
MVDVDHQRLMAKVARLYHTRGLRQIEIAERLNISQSRVSRLLTQAEDLGMVRTVVVPPDGLNVDLEEELERSYSLSEAYVVDTVADDDEEFTRDLGQAAASILANASMEPSTIGFTSWSRTLREVVAALPPMRTGATYVVEMLGDLGPPKLQHEAARSTQHLAQLTGAEPVFLRIPGVAASPEVREALLAQDAYARQALHLLDSLDLALVSVGNCTVAPPLQLGRNFFTAEQLQLARSAGAVAEVCMRFMDAEGRPVETPLDDLVTGLTLDQLRSAKRRWAIAGGPDKHDAIEAALRGGWFDAIVTDSETAIHLVTGARKSAPSVTGSVC